MMFADVQLAARIERAECRLARDWAEATRSKRPERDVQVHDVAGGLVCYVGPGAPLNKVLGLGFAGVPAVDQVESFEAMFRDRDCPVQVEIASLGDPALHAFFTERGYALRSFENVLGFDLRGAPNTPPDPDAEIQIDGPEGLATWLDTIVTGFLARDAQGAGDTEEFQRAKLEEIIGDMAGSDGFVRYLARAEGEVAAAGTMRVAHGVAHMCGASTLPPHRRRGLQTALVRRRLADAAAQHAELAVMTTQPGSKSQQNAQKQGFALLYTRAVLVKQG